MTPPDATRHPLAAPLLTDVLTPDLFGRVYGIRDHSSRALGLPRACQPTDDLTRIIESITIARRREQWVPTRLILLNCWVFGYQVFVFTDGHLALKGANGTGKTTVLSAALPVALFGTTAPGALDTLSGKSRTLEYLVLGADDDLRDKLYIETERTTHIFLEFRRPTDGRYLTVGQIITGSRVGSAARGEQWNKNGVVIRDGRRIGKELALWSIGTNGVMDQPWTGSEARTALVDLAAPSDDRNLVTEDQAEFRRMVARDLFGTDRVADLMAYERTLRAVRRPMLNSDFKPAVVCDILRESLPDLDSALLDKIDASLAELDRTQATLKEREAEWRVVTLLRERHEALVQARAEMLAKHLSFFDTQVRGFDTKIKQAIDKRLEAERDRGTYAEEQRNLEAELAGVKEAIRILSSNQFNALAESRVAAISDVSERADRETAALTAQHKRVSEVVAATQAKSAAEAWVHDALDRLRGMSDDLVKAGDAARWAAARGAAHRVHEAVASALLSSAVPSVATADVPSALTAAAAERREVLGLLVRALLVAERADAALRSAREAIAPLDDAVKAAGDQARDAAADYARARTTVMESLAHWAAGSMGVLDTRSGVDATLDHLQAWRLEDGEPSLEPIHRDLRDSARRRDDILTSTKSAHHEAARLLASTRDEYRRISAESDNPPPAPAGHADVLTALASATIPALPFYLAVDLAPDASLEEVALLEQVLLDTGILTAVVVAPADLARAQSVVSQMSADTLAHSALRPAADRSNLTPTSHLAPLRAADNAGPLQSAATALLPSIVVVQSDDDARSFTLGTDGLIVDLRTGEWAHGALSGVTRTGRTAPQYLGLAHRMAARALRLATLQSQIADQEATVTVKATAVDVAQADREDVDNGIAALRKLPVMTLLGTARASALRAEDETKARERLAKKTALLQQLQGACATADDALREARRPIPEFREASRADVDAATHALETWGRLANEWPGAWKGATDATVAVRREEDRIETATEEAEVAAGQYDEAQAAHARAREVLSQIDLLLRSEEARSHAAMLDEKREREKALELAIRSVLEKAVTVGGRVTEAQREEGQHRDSRVSPEGFRQQYATVFEQYLLAHPLHPSVGVAATVLVDGPDRFRAALRKFGASQVRQDALAPLVSAVDAARQEFSMEFSTRRAELEVYTPAWITGTDEVTANVGDVAVRSLPALEQALQNIVEQQRSLIQVEQDQMYRRIFLESLADALRRQIREAKDMVKALNAILAAKPVQDGEVLGVVWRPAKAVKKKSVADGALWATEEEVRRREEVVRILMDREVRNATNEAQATVFEYFRDRLETLRQAFGATNNASGLTHVDGRSVKTFRDVLGAAFDYRLWYEFALMSRQTSAEGAGAQEITEQRFLKRSAGQRVAATLVPLAAALEVRCQAFGPASMAPRLIALDEAFAGVDEENTAALFHILEDFQMSWIMTSEKIDASNAELHGATTCVLTKRVRSDKPSVVAVDHLVWDGQNTWDSELALEHVPAALDEQPVNGRLLAE
jgi:hypothetical protein